MTRHIPSADRLAERFGAMLLAAVGSDAYAEIRRRNAASLDPAVCASHDFCDANMIMADAMLSLGIAPTAALHSDKHCKLWNDAWDMWKK